MVSHYGTSKSGRKAFFPCQNLEDFSTTKSLLNKWTIHMASTQDHSNTELNSREVLIYRGPLSQTTIETMDHCSFHNGDGECMKEGTTVVTGCIGTTTTVLRIVRNPKTVPDTGEQHWIVTPSNSGYAFGGKHFHHYYSRKVLLNSNN